MQLIICARQMHKLLSDKNAHTEKNAHADKTAHVEANAHAEKNMNIQDVPTSTFNHRLFSGKIVACHAIDPGSIPGRCNLLSALEKCANYY